MPILLKKLYDYNKQYELKSMQWQRRLRGNSEHIEWGGAKLRMMMQCIYTIAFLCLLCFDEVLRIELKDIEVIDNERGQIKLTLPFRKTHQYGGISTSSAFTSLEIKPFHLFFNRQELHLDPVHLLLRWIRVSRLTTGSLFRRIDAQDRVSMNITKTLV